MFLGNPPDKNPRVGLVSFLRKDRAKKILDNGDFIGGLRIRLI